MTLFRIIPLPVHGAIEAFAAPVIMVAPFVLGFEAAAMVFTVVLGALLFGLSFATHAGERPSIPLQLHALADYGIGIAMVLAAIVLGLARGDAAATIFLVAAGIAHTALTTATRFSAPRAAH